MGAKSHRLHIGDFGPLLLQSKTPEVRKPLEAFLEPKVLTVSGICRLCSHIKIL